MSVLSLLPFAKLLAVALLGVALALAVSVAVVTPDTVPRRLLFRYLTTLERRMRLMFMTTPPVAIVAGQATLLLGSVACALTGVASALLLVPVIVFAPVYWLEQKRKKRVEKIEEVLDGFVLALANALRATPNAGKALASIHAVTPAPLDEEIELVLREMRVGSTLEQALGNLSARVRSFQLDAAMSGLLIGRQTGGNVPQILNGAAETLREMARLQGVLRTKTAEARAQANLLALFPLFLVFGFDKISPGYFTPLTSSAAGMAVASLAVVMWIASVVLMRRIMEVEL